MELGPLQLWQPSRAMPHAAVPNPCRYLTGRGVPLLPDEGLRHAKAAAPALMPELEESGAAQG